jgi:hypothetical protein
VEAAKLAQFAESIVALCRSGKGKDTVGDPFVGAEDGGFRMLAHEGELFEVVGLKGD